MWGKNCCEDALLLRTEQFGRGIFFFLDTQLKRVIIVLGRSLYLLSYTEEQYLVKLWLDIWLADTYGFLHFEGSVLI